MMVAVQIVGCDYDWAKAEHEAHGPLYSKLDDSRQTGKVVNFGCPGGLGAASLVHFAENNYGVILTENQAADLKALWRTTWPEMPEYHRWINQIVRSGHPLKHIYSNRYRGGLTFTEACNSPFQGLGSDIAKAAGYEIARGCYLDTESPLWGCRIVNFVHDEFILEAPEHRSHEAAIELSRIMVAEAKPWLPRVKIASKPVIMRRWSKEAKQIWRDGRLQAWDLAA
jgi:DNA polymerase I-like protein with 3'-5' exonuclease and polymerase domains